MDEWKQKEGRENACNYTVDAGERKKKNPSHIAAKRPPNKKGENEARTIKGREKIEPVVSTLKLESCE